MMQQERANTLVAQGNDYREKGDLENAVKSYQQAIALVPAYESLNLVVGDMLFEYKNYAAAAEAYQAVVAAFPEHDQAWAGLGQCLMILSDHNGAAAALDNAVKQNPTDALSWFYSAMVHTLLEDTTRAKACLKEALRLQPGWEDRARNEDLFQPYFEDGWSPTKKRWQFWKK